MKNKVRELRKDKKLSQEQLAEKLGVSRQTIISIENEEYCPSLPLSRKISKFFGYIIEEVFEFED